MVLVCLGIHHLPPPLYAVDQLQSRSWGPSTASPIPSRIQSFYSVGIVLALFASAALLKRNVEPAKTLVASSHRAPWATLVAIYLVQEPVMCLAGSFLLGFFAAGGVLQLVTAVAKDVPQEPGRHHPHRHDRLQRGQLSVVSVAGVSLRIGGIESPS